MGRVVGREAANAFDRGGFRLFVQLLRQAVASGGRGGFRAVGEALRARDYRRLSIADGPYSIAALSEHARSEAPRGRLGEG